MSQFQLFPELAAPDYEALKADITLRGVLVPVLYDQDGTLLDGHHRERIAHELGVSVPTWQVECRNDDERRAVVRAVNLYRRHLTPEQRAEHASALRAEGWTIEGIADAAGVSKSQVARDLATFPNGKVPERVVGRDGKSRPAQYAPRTTPKMAVHYSSESAEWHTPGHILDAVVVALGGIDLDPCAEPAKAVPAARHLTIEDDGLAHGWRGRVYMNPPYGGVIGDWTDKLSDEYEHGNVSAAVALVPGRVDTSWYQRIPAVVACHVSGRLRFSGADAGAPFPSVALYLGPEPSQFEAAFGRLGSIWERRQ